MDETANELARLRQLRLEVTHNPQAALNITTGRELNADENKFQYAMPMAAYSPGPSHNPAATIAQVSGIQGQLRSHLAKNHGKVLDLFRTWDVDGDGTVRKVEMRRAVASLGFEAPPSAVDALFDSFDRDHGGGIEYKELCRVLLESLSQFGVPLAPRLFEGVTCDKLRCTSCGLESTRRETFCDVPLDIGGVGTLQQALHNFVGMERMEGADAWCCGQCGARSSEKVTRFEQLPQLMTLQLKRFIFDR